MFEHLLAITWNVNPVILHLGKLPIRWYSLLFISGFILGYFIFKWYYKREGLDIKLLDPLLYALLIGTIVGARLGHCLFYEPDYFLAHPLEILYVWKGGLASHGGAIGVLLAIWWYSYKYGRKNGFDMMWVLDRLVITICFAGAFIRLGNLMNSEIYGNPTNLPWGFIFVRRGETIAKHPTQIYESLSYLILGLSLLWAYRYKLKKLYKGEIFGIFLIVLFGMRFLIEYIKEPQEAFEQNMHLNMGQLLSIPFILAGIVILVLSFVYKRPATLKEDSDAAGISGSSGPGHSGVSGRSSGLGRSGYSGNDDRLGHSGGSGRSGNGGRSGGSGRSGRSGSGDRSGRSGSLRGSEDSRGSDQTNAKHPAPKKNNETHYAHPISS